ncbi:MULTISPECIES: lysophospholipid acyltransferase family protein [unclassified Gordonia (in: high G+C Gram-positive bacteria)]|uniref:lysophospholipid acyltransferase family protein n=1 Tax=unclassified Gordonia (in: high G+C Gram-positive bacteria) TaxID=2657482 RepID=UPI001F061101|nr:lysophospholipid acyltransferase family protein [Gordonia sp. PDNC005]
MPTTASVLYPLCKHVLIGPPLRRRIDVTVIGRDNVPDDGPVIIASNHLAEIDSLMLPLAIRRRLSFLAKSEYFTGAGIRGRAARAFFAGTGQIPVDRSGGDHAALDAAERVLRSGRVWAIYPEGTRSPDGRLHRGHTGAMRVASRVPGTSVVPVVISGTPDVTPAGSRRVRPGVVTVHIGEPLSADALLGPEQNARAATDELMAAIRRLGDLAYVDEYARK